MADDEKQETEAAKAQEQAEEPRKNRGPLKLLLGVVLLVATGGALAVMAVPAKEKEHKFEGPFFGKLLEEVVVSTSDNSATRYLKFTVDAEYAAYQQAYFTARSDDPFYASYLEAEAQQVASARTIDQTAIGPEREQFAAALRVALEPIVFPVHIGKTVNPLDPDQASGLRPGVSHHAATFRGRFHRHVLRVDASAGVLQLDDGPEISFHGDEDDLEVRSALGQTVYLDVTHLEPEFQGELKVGVHGKLRTIILKVIAQ